MKVTLSLLYGMRANQKVKTVFVIKSTAELKAKNKAAISTVMSFHAMMHSFNAQAMSMQEMYKGIHHNRTIHM